MEFEDVVNCTEIGLTHAVQLGKVQLTIKGINEYFDSIEKDASLTLSDPAAIIESKEAALNVQVAVEKVKKELFQRMGWI